jgi:1,3-propanediol dehydrogenase
MAVAATMAMYAATLSGVGLVHFLGEPVQKRAHVSHAMSCVLILPYIMEFNMISCPEKFARIAEILGEDVAGLPVLDAAMKSVDAVKRLAKLLGMDKNLGDFGVTDAQVDEIVDEMFADKAFILGLCNARNVSHEDAAMICRRAIRGE